MEMNKSKKLIEFFSECKSNLFHYGLEDEAFYFEMIRDHLIEGGDLDPKNVRRILGL
jgi:hypothetical protein